MTRAATICAVLGVALVVFATWGTKTAAGRQRFDEMAGMIPYFAGWLGALLLVVAVGLFVVGLSRR